MSAGKAPEVMPMHNWTMAQGLVQGLNLGLNLSSKLSWIKGFTKSKLS